MKKYYPALAVLFMLLLPAISNSQNDYKEWVRKADNLSRHKSDSIIYFYRQAEITAPDTARSEIYRKMGRVFSFYHTDSIYRGFHRKTDSAILYFQKAIAVSPNNAQAWRSAGMAYEWMDQPENARVYYTKGLDVSPANDGLWSSLVHLYFSMKKTDSAFYFTKKWIDISPKSKDALYLFATWYDNKQGFYDSAIYYYERLIPANIAKEKMAYHIMSTDKSSTLPFQYLTDLINEWPSAWRYYYGIACYYGNRGENDKAMEYFTKALQRGMRNRVQVEGEPMLATVRETDSYKKAISAYPSW